MTTAEIIAAISAIASFGTLVVAATGLNAIRSVHVSINSRMDELLKKSAIAAHAEGREEYRMENHPKQTKQRKPRGKT